MKVNRLCWCFAVVAPVLACTDTPEPESPDVESQSAAIRPAPATTQGEQQTANKVDFDADAVLRSMSDHLGSLQSFSFSADHTIDFVLESGEKRQAVASSTVSVQRPNKLRSDRRGEHADLSFIYDGRTATIYGKRNNMYAQADAPDTIDEMIDFAREKLDIDAPAADLLYSKSYPILMEDVVSGTIVGPAIIDDKPCTHLAFRGNNVDWQLWIQDGGTPLPLRYVITTKDVKSEPQLIVQIHDWNTAPSLAPELFTFAPPAGAQKIEFYGLMQQKPGAK
jgi:hypothetical protein